MANQMNVSQVGQYGQGGIVYSTGNKKNTPLAQNEALLKLRDKIEQDELAAEYEAKKAAQKAAEQKAAWESYQNAPKQGDKFDEVFKFRQKEIEEQQRKQRFGDYDKALEEVEEQKKNAPAPEPKPEPAPNQEPKPLSREERIAKLNEKITGKETKPSYYGGKTVKEGGVYVAKDSQTVAQEALKNASKKSGILGKIGNFIGKNKKAMIGAGIVAALVGGVIALFSGKKDKTAEEAQQSSVIFVPAEKNKEQEQTPVVPPAEENEEPEEKQPAPAENNTEYTVVKGDNVWNIAKANLIAEHKDDKDYKPTNAEILKRTYELVELNGLKWEPDNYHVMIRPGDKLQLIG